MALNLIMFGPPGAGKGTQAERFARTRGIPKISTGDILREAVHARTVVGRNVKAIMERGELVSDDVMIGIVRERLDRDDARSGFVLDGFPRTIPQAKALDQMMNGRAPLIVVEIVVPESELVRRLSMRMVCDDCGATAGGFDVVGGVSSDKMIMPAASVAMPDVPAAVTAQTEPVRCRRCGGRLVQRSDDDDAIVRERLKVYTRLTKPLVEHYQSRPTFRSVNGLQPPDVVAAALVVAVEAAGNGLAGVGVRP